MVVACYLERSRPHADAVIFAFAQGCHSRIVTTGRFDPEASDHIVMSTWPTTQHVLAECRRLGAPYWHLDSAWIHPVKREPRYYRLTRNGPSPELLPGRSLERIDAMGVVIRPWRNNGGHVLVCRQGASAGLQWQTEPNAWNDAAIQTVRMMTDRQIRVREKWHRYKRPLAADLENAWAIVSHSSTCAVQAAIAGVPVFCHETNAAAPIGSNELANIEEPRMSSREEWMASLSWQQWTLDELRIGAWLP